MEEGEIGAAGEEAEPAKLNCGVVGRKGCGEGGEGDNREDEGAPVGGWGVGYHRWRRQWLGEGDRRLLRGGGGGAGREKAIEFSFFPFFLTINLAVLVIGRPI